MPDIEQIAIRKYELNMLYLQKNHLKLCKDLQNLDMAIQNNHYQQQYDLEYIEGNFDIKEISSGKYLYNKQSNKTHKSYAEHTSLDKNKSTIETFALYNLSEKDINTDKHHIRAKKYIYPMMKYSLENSKNNTKMKKIVKFIFSGVGLGLHIEAIDKKINASQYLIIEDNIEIFKLSLFTTNYYEIAKNAKIYFSVLEDVHTFTETYNKFMKDSYTYNYLLKYNHLKTHSLTKLKHIISLAGSQLFVAFPYQLQLDKLISPLKYIKKGYPLLNIYTNIDQSILKNKPILVIASGPSLSKNIKWLKNNHSKFVIVAVSSSLTYLYKNNVTPDIVVSADQQEIVKDFFSQFKYNDYLKNSILLFSSVTHENVIKSVNKKNIFITDVSLQYKSENPTFSFSCVGSFAYLYSISLKAENTYVLGLDLAVDQDTGDDHISDHIKSNKLNIKNATELPLEISLTDTLIPIEGNFNETVYTTPSFHHSIFTINKFASNLKTENQNIYNLNHGAKITAAKAMEISKIGIEKIPQLNKSELHILLKNSLKQNSSNELNKLETELMLNHQLISEKIKKNILKYSKKTPSSNYNNYIKKLLKLSDDIYLYEQNRPIAVYRVYFEYALNIICDFFNTQDIQDTKQHIIEFDRMILHGLNAISKQLEEY